MTHVPLFICLSVLLLGCRSGESVDEGRTLALSLDPGPGNPRNSEGDFIELKDGRILFVYTHFTGESVSDHAPAYLAGRYSSDQGRTWTQDDRPILDREGEMNVMSVSMLRLKNGKLALFYLRKNSITDCVPFVRFSSDEGETWSSPVSCISGQKGYFVLNNDRVIQLKNGRLLLAVALHTSPEGQWQDKGTLLSCYSDDSGLTWTMGTAVPDTTDIVTQEPGLAELNDGRVMMFIRSNAGEQLLSYSSDSGETWTQVHRSGIPSPLSPASIARIPGTGDLLLVWNNNDGSDEAMKGIRSPLTVAISKDEGVSWEKVKDLETDPDGWYCYTAIHFTDDGVLLGYCAGSQKQKTSLSVTRVTRLSQEWLYQ